MLALRNAFATGGDPEFVPVGTGEFEGSGSGGFADMLGVVGADGGFEVLLQGAGLLRIVVRGSHSADQARIDQFVQDGSGLLGVAEWVGTMELIQVDVVEAHAIQGAPDAFTDIVGRVIVVAG